MSSRARSSSITGPSRSPALVDHGAQPIAGLHDALEQLQRELAADHRAHLERALRGVVQAVEPRHQHVLDGVGNGDAAQIPGQRDAAVLDTERAVLQQRLGHLLDEEGIALGP
jgi:hypothetical protein